MLAGLSKNEIFSMPPYFSRQGRAARAIAAAAHRPQPQPPASIGLGPGLRNRCLKSAAFSRRIAPTA